MRAIGGDVQEAVGVEEPLAVPLGQGEPALGRGRAGVVDREEPGHGLLLEPLASVALVDAGARGELGAGLRPALVERPVQAEPVADVDAGQLHRGEQRAEHALGERLAGLRDRCLGGAHRSSSSSSCGAIVPERRLAHRLAPRLPAVRAMATLAAVLTIRVIGGVEADVDGVPVDLSSAARARGLLAWLAVHPGTHPRSVLAARLRPDVLDESARKSLRQAAWSLRSALGPAGAALVGDRERLGLSDDPALVSVDLAGFRRLRDAGDLAGAAALASGELLDGLDEEWAAGLREAHRGGGASSCSGGWPTRPAPAATPAAAIGWARRQVAADPLAEIAARRLIALLARAGDRAGALARLRRPARAAAPRPGHRRVGRDARAGGGGAPRPPGADGRRGRGDPAAAAAPLVREGAFVGRAAPPRASRRPGATRPRARASSAWPGEPGIGKTRLAAHVAASVHAGGALVLYGRCDEDTLVPHQPFVEALERHLRRAAAGRARRGDRRPPRRPGPGAAGGRPARGRRPHDPDPETARYRAFEAVRAVVQACAAGRPALLVLDDLHWADQASLLLLRHLGRMLDPVPLLVLGTYRDTEVGAGHPLAARWATCAATTRW